jgi:hypothetical protein
VRKNIEFMERIDQVFERRILCGILSKAARSLLTHLNHNRKGGGIIGSAYLACEKMKNVLPTKSLALGISGVADFDNQYNQ